MDDFPIRILVVDDEKTIRDGLKIVLSEEKYEVEGAGDGREGYEKARAGEFDIALIDLKMPVMSGMDLIQKINEEEIELLPVVITGYASISSAVQAMKAGAYDYLAKPFTPDEILYVVNRAVETVRLKRSRLKLIEEREMSLKDLESEKGRLKTVLESIGDGIIVTDSAGNIVLANPAVYEMFLREGRKDIPDSIKNKIESMRQRIENTSDESFSRLVEEVGLEDGSDSVLAISCSPVISGRGDLIGYVNSIYDITHQKEIDRARMNFIMTVTHELKAPIGAIQGYLDLVLDGTLDDDPDKVREVIGRSRNSASSLLTMIQNLLSAIRKHSGLRKSEFEQVQLAEIGKQAVDLLRVRADEVKVEIEFDAAGDLQTIEADKSDMNDLLNNLLSNAVKYNKPGGKVVVSMALVNDDYVEIKCADTGVGIPSEAVPHLFDEFFRVRGEATRNVPGTGLGLFIVKNIVDSHGGKIDVSSKPGEGTEFRVILPVRRKARENG
ncbi:MAG TPA: response regulator [bacterium]|nr:response regulator [bacterium]